MSSLIKTAQLTSLALRDFLFPAECCLCGIALLDASSRMSPCCLLCQEEFPKPIEHACCKCGAEVGAYVETSSGCHYCKTDSFSFRSAIAYGTYTAELKQLCQICKNPASQDVAWLLGEKFWQARGDELGQLQIDCLTTVPMHWTNRLVRRIHPNEVLAKCLAKQLKVPCLQRCLIQRLRTVRQSSLSPSLRRKNVRDVYRVRPIQKLQGKTVLLVDDILTTGATANACSRLLLAAGCAAVYVAVVARGVGS